MLQLIGKRPKNPANIPECFNKNFRAHNEKFADKLYRMERHENYKKIVE